MRSIRSEGCTTLLLEYFGACNPKMHCRDREKALTQKLESKEFLCPRAVTTDTCMQCSGNRVNQTKLGITFEKSAFC